MSGIRKILCLLFVTLIFTVSSATPVFAECATAFTFRLQESEVSDEEANYTNYPAKSPETGDTGCQIYLISAVCAGGAAVCLTKFKRQENN